MKFAIRDLLLVATIVALVAGWWVDRSTLESELKNLKSNWVEIQPGVWGEY